MTTNDHPMGPGNEDPRGGAGHEPQTGPTPPSGQVPPSGQAPPWAGHGGPAGSPPFTGPPPAGPPPFTGPPPAGPTPGDARRNESTAGFFDSLRRTGIWRGQDRWIGGVASGVARRLDVDPLLVRGVFVVLTIFGGLGLLLYGLGWALLPEESDGRIHTQEALRGNVDAALAGAIAFVVVGLARPGGWWDGWWWFGDGWFTFTLVSLAIIAVVAVALGRRSRPPHGPRPGPGGYGPGPGGDNPGGYTQGSHNPGPAGGAAPHGPAAYGPSPAATGSTAAPGGVPEATAGPASWGTAYAAAAPATSASWQSPPASGVPWSGRAVQAPRRPPTPPRPRTPGPGRTLVAVTIALVLLATAAALLWDRTAGLWSAPLVVGGSAAVLLGLGVMVAAVRGRRGGTLSWLGILAALLLLPMTIAASIAPLNLGEIGVDGAVGDHRFAPQSATAAESGYNLMAGELDVDLTGFDLTDEPVVVPVSVGTGQVRVTVPDGTAAQVDVRLGTGDVVNNTGWTSDNLGRSTGTGIDATFSSPETADTEPQLVVHVRGGAGQIILEEK